jgi:spectinomycin phosphotransferase
MLEKPAIPDKTIIACIQQAYGLSIAEIAFLPLGADVSTAVYRVRSGDQVSYFVKLRKGNFEETSVTLPKFLSGQGIPGIISPIETKTHALWTTFEDFHLILHPFIERRDGFRVVLSENQWFDFGAALNRIHNTEIPPKIRENIKHETYSQKWRQITRRFLEQIGHESFADPVAVELTVFLKNKQDVIEDLLLRTERLALKLQADSSPNTVCHADAHAGNLLIEDGSNKLYIVDWDNPILAPRERDLMFIGGGQGFKGYTAEEEETLFYRGYGQTATNLFALTYYRYERIIQDIAAYCQELLLTDEGGSDRAQSLQYLKSNFLPGGTIELARRSDTSP